MINFSQRSSEQELMDDPRLPEEDLNNALKDISKVNKWLGGNAITVNAVSSLIEKYPNKDVWSVADIGCGDGEMLRLLSKRFSKSGKSFSFKGIDVSQTGLETARTCSKDFTDIQFCQENILTSQQIERYDIVLCTLTLHHIPTEQIIPFLEAMTQRAQYAVIINDLQRSKIAYHLFKVFSRIFMQSPIAKNDGLVSIASSFKRDELEKYAQVLGLKKYTITWKWAFRYLWYIQCL